MALSSRQLQLINEMSDVSGIVAMPQYHTYVMQLPLNIDQKEFNFDQVPIAPPHFFKVHSSCSQVLLVG